MDPGTANEFLAACNEAFGFLVTNHGFKPAALKIDSQIHFATVSFVGRNLAVQCIFDQNERWVEVKIARVENGAPTTHYSTDSSGRLVRESLIALLIRRGVRGFGSTVRGDLSKLPLNDMFRIKLSLDADLLRMHGADILADSSSVFASK
jgi:hypothetical protein